MTAQMTDTCLFQDQKFSIVGVNGNGLFDPANYDIQPRPRITSCWRGYVCTYKTLYNKFLLDQLQLNLDEEGPVINNVQPVFARENTFENTYQDLSLPIDFTGSMLIAQGFIQELYVHMGFHPAWKYKMVFELTISHGYVLDTKDMSEKMAKVREEMIRKPLQPGPHASKQELEDWVTSTFRTDYEP